MEDEEFIPYEILEVRRLPAGSEACHQVLVRWDNKPKEEATWMDCLNFQTLTLWTRFVLRRMELIGLDDISFMQEGRKEANHTWHHNRGRVEWFLQEENVRDG
ncbi:hypothetical protein V2J09_011105 [Rumex salicifolius]